MYGRGKTHTVVGRPRARDTNAVVEMVSGGVDKLKLISEIYYAGSMS